MLILGYLDIFLKLDVGLLAAFVKKPPSGIFQQLVDIDPGTGFFAHPVYRQTSQIGKG